MKQQIKYLAALLVVLLSTMTATAQTTSHEVQRGETLDIIAQKYGITTEALLQANPDAADMFFTGMKLRIPAAASTTTSTTTTTTSTTTTAPTSSTTTTTTTAVAVQPTPQATTVSENTASAETMVEAQSRKGKWETAFEIGYGFLQFPKIEGYKTSAFGYKASMGANYNISDV